MSTFYAWAGSDPEPDPNEKRQAADSGEVRHPALPVAGAAPAAPHSSAVQGSFRLFRFTGTDVFIHWTWFAAAWFVIGDRQTPYSSLAWAVLEYVAGFTLVLLHEFGHVLACRSVGGSAGRVVLWPLGGLAFVAPPPRPGANLWTTAAGPLVNVLFAPLLFGVAFQTAPVAGAPATDIHLLCTTLALFNVVMLVFNLLPIFPLDGGRILQSLLWWPLGEHLALAIAAGVGMAFASVFGVLALLAREWWLLATAVFLLVGAYEGLARARQLGRLKSAARWEGLLCGNCGIESPVGPFWLCTRCRQWFDLHGTGGCPDGRRHTPSFSCPDCGR
jgi:Zn-dependent protease